MAITLDKTWQHDPNQVVTTSGTALTDARNLLLGIVNSLLRGCLAAGGGSNAATVAYSCDGTTAGTAGDGVNRWSVITKLNWSSTTGRSWIVLNLTGLAPSGTAQVLIALDATAAAGNTITIQVSDSGAFTGGSISANPTATDSRNWFAGTAQASWISSSAASYRYHCQQSSDGQVRRIWIAQAGKLITLIHFERPKSPISGLTSQVVGHAKYAGSTADVTTYTNYNTLANICVRYNTTNSVAYLTAESIGPSGTATALGQRMTAVGDISGGWPGQGMGYFCDTVGMRDRWGSAYDLWWGSTAPITGDDYDATPSHEIVQVGHMVTPAGGVQWLMT